MKILALHSDHVSFAPTKKALKSAEDVTLETTTVKECLVVFTAVEEADEANPKGSAALLVKEACAIAEQVKADKIVLYPYAHLSSALAKPDVAIAVLKEAEAILKKDKHYEVYRAPFGWYKAFEVKCKGHPLSELSREFTTQDEEKKTHSHDHRFAYEPGKLDNEEQVAISAGLLVAQALKEMNPKIQLGQTGFVQGKAYLDVAGISIKKEQLKSIENRVKALLKRPEAFTKAQSVESSFQQEILEELGKDAVAFQYKDVQLVALHQNAFIAGSDGIGAFKALDVSSAYWRNNANNEQLTRIYWVAFSLKEKLQEYEERMAAAEARDHRKLGQQLRLFSMHEEAPGMPFFHDNGTFIYNKLLEFMTNEMRALGYEQIKTPMILNKKLWLQSGHWDHYKENMYFTKIDEADYAVKPMNCPGHILVFKTRHHSYRDLPIKAGEFGIVHRHELSGVLSGLFRVRFFTQDDAHVFCTHEQIKEQIMELIDLVHRIYSAFGFTYAVELSTKPKKAMGDPKLWEVAEESLAAALKAKRIDYNINAGDGAFYGPKIDYHVKDALGRSWQCGTIQLDFSMPEKFGLKYEGSDGKQHQPVMIHRAIYGSLERFIGILIEHFAGKFPLWISPMPVRIVTVTDRSVPFAKEVLGRLTDAGIRATLDDRQETIGKKVREAQLDKVNYIVTIGDKEDESGQLAIRSRDGTVEHEVAVDTFLERLRKEIAERSA